jgi:dihydroflavonol-4-reductase
MKAFVTGGTGLLGSNLVDLLVREGHTAKVLARSAHRAVLLPSSAQVEVVRGDLTDVAGFGEELAGCDVVFHCASYHREYSDRGDHRGPLQRVNVDATVSLLGECRARGVMNVVFVSSNGATGPAADGTAQTEACGYDERTKNLYFQSKVRAEKAIDASRAQSPGMRVVIVRPAMMIGPKDSGPSPAGQVVRQMLGGEMPVILPGNIVVVDARDVAFAVLAAATHGKEGERFIVGGRAVAFSDLAASLHDVSGAPFPKRRPAYPVAITILGLMTLLSTVTRRSLPVRPEDLRRMHRLRAPDSSKAAHVLGVAFRPLAESLRDTADWFRAEEGSAARSPTVARDGLARKGGLRS